ncbi:hypothetical protein RA210_U340018 [Rubrivivax sp. A210]|nr:hypothetical protein RA210_U340018 [Rubrivivax sp. A210]
MGRPLKVQTVPRFAFKFCANCLGNTLTCPVVRENHNLQASKAKFSEAEYGRLMCREPCYSLAGSL